jgi:hypothetical protein
MILNSKADNLYFFINFAAKIIDSACCVEVVKPRNTELEQHRYKRVPVDYRQKEKKTGEAF